MLPVVVTRDNKPVAVLLSVTDPDEIERLAMSQSKKLRRILDKSRAQIAKGKGIPEEEFWRQARALTFREVIDRLVARCATSQ